MNNLQHIYFLDYIKSANFFWTLVVIASGIFVLILLTKLFKKHIGFLEKSNQKEANISKRKTITHFVCSLLRCIVIIVDIIIILQINGFNVTSLITGVGLVSAVLGLALQDAIKDIITGFHILTDHYFDVGDVIRYENIDGEVISMTLRSTKIKNIYTKDILTIANRNFSEASIVSNMVDIDLPLSYKEDITKVHSILKTACEKIEKIEGVDSCIFKGTQQFAESAVVYKISFFCNPVNIPQIRRNVLTELQKILADNNISIPYNQLDIHTK